jgi:uncharacterized protein (DUF488 family)
LGGGHYVTGAKGKLNERRLVMKEIYTIGYSCFKIDDFVNVLKKYNINCVVDVRSNPNSKFYTDYNYNELENTLKEHNILYRNYKKEFGAQQENTKYYRNGYLDFESFCMSEAFREGMRKIEAGIELKYIFVLMCAEKDPIKCHRTLMIANEFHKSGYKINNILFDGTIETQESIEQRLLDIYFPKREQMSFLEKDLSVDEMVRESYKMRNEEIGYRNELDEDKYNE